MHRNRRIIEDNRGFTLLELIVTVVILALIAAPFLSSFVSAARNNVKAKRVEESNELGEYIIEQFKGSAIDDIKDKFSLTAATTAATGVEEFSKLSTKYSVTGFDMSSISSDYKNYKVDIDLYPSQILVNSDDAVPEIDKLDRSQCVVLVDNLTKFDIAATTERKVTADISYDVTEHKFYVAVNVDTYSYGTRVSGRTSPWEWEFDTVPSLYMLYKPAGTGDVIEINNLLKTTDYDDYNDNVATSDDEKIHYDEDKVNIYIVNQRNTLDTANSYYVDLSAANVKFREGSATASQYSLENLYKRITSKNDTRILGNTVVYSNLWETTTSIAADVNRSDKDDTVNGVVKLKKLDTIYNLDVKVYNGDSTDYITKFSTTKSAGN